MGRARVRSFRGQLLTLVAIASALSTICVGGVLVVSNYVRQRQQLIAGLGTQAEIVALNAAAPLTFMDPDAGSEILAALRAERYVAGAMLLDQNGLEFASMSRDEQESVVWRNDQGAADPPGWVVVHRPVSHDGVTAGTLVLAYDLRPLHAGLRRDLALSLALGFLAAAVALLVAFRLQRRLALPVAELAAVARRVTSTRDFSLRARRHAEDELGLLTDDFNRMLVEMEESNRQIVLNHGLRIAKEAAEASNRAKGEFLAHMSHEIRTPLNGVTGLLDLLLGMRLPAKQHRYASLAKTSAESLTSIINDILDFSKIEAGKLDIVNADFDVQRLVEEVLQILAPRSSQKGIDLVSHVHPDVPRRLHGDASRMRQVLLNLVTNAIKFTERGAVVVRAVIDTAGEGSIILRFAVSDTGIGIPYDRVERLFKAFSQADASTTRVYGGTGLGLAISKRLAELMGGEIGVETEPGRGSTFWFTSSLGAAAPGEDVLGVHGLEVRSLRVLAVDDSPIQRAFLREQIESWGLEAGVAEDGDSALRLLASAAAEGTPFRVAIIDRDMPGMDGLRLAESVKRDPAISKTALMLLLTSDGDMAPYEMRELGFVGWLSKPVRQSLLFDAIMDAIAVSEGAAWPERLADPPGMACETPSRVARARILLAEDNEINQVVATDLLARSGFDCDVVADGAAAVKAAMSGRYDAVLMDCQMPVMDGLTASREIRRIEAHSGGFGARGVRIPIVALTANAMRGDDELCLAAGMDAYTSKPINPDELVATLVAVIEAPVEARRAA